MNLSDFKKYLRSHQTDAEAKLWYFLRAKRFKDYKFRRQVSIGPYIVDYICCHKKIIIEIDGGQHNEFLNQTKDSARTSYLEAKGFKVIRFWNDEVLMETDSVLDQILNVLNPSP